MLRNIFEKFLLVLGDFQNKNWIIEIIEEKIENIVIIEYRLRDSSRISELRKLMEDLRLV